MTEKQINAKKFLFHVAYLPMQIESIMLEIEVMRAKAEGLGAIRYDKDRVQTSPQDTMSDAVIKLIEFVDGLEEKHVELVEQRMKADELMEFLDDEQRAVIDMYFFQRKSIYQIGKIMNYCDRTIKYRMNAALEIIGERLEMGY